VNAAPRHVSGESGVSGISEAVAIVGAGYAGMAAAVALAERGFAVQVFEAGRVPGGRARRVTSHGHTLDNGQHLLVGAYRELLRLMRRVGVPASALLRMRLELRSVQGFALRALPLPAPLGLLGGLLLARGVPFADRIGAVRFMRSLRARGFRLADDCSVSALLEQHDQNDQIGRRLWIPLCIAALNVAPERASANAFLAVLRDALMGPSGASDLLLPRTDLSRLFPEPAAEYVRAAGGIVLDGQRVTAIDETGGFHGSRRFEQQLLGELERAYDSVDHWLGLRPGRRIDVVVYDPAVFDAQFGGALQDVIREVVMHVMGMNGTRPFLTQHAADGFHHPGVV